MLHGTGFLLLTTVAGYWVLERAESHKGTLRRVGKLIGWVVIVGSLVGVACRFCPKYSCPFSPKSSPSAPNAK